MAPLTRPAGAGHPLPLGEGVVRNIFPSLDKFAGMTPISNPCELNQLNGARPARCPGRTLMQKLRMHPDLGGNNWNAALINEEYAVLHDPLKREQYDRQTQEVAADVAPPEAKRGHCLCCKSILLIVPGRTASESCPECRNPLQGINDDETQIALRRTAARTKRTFDKHPFP